MRRAALRLGVLLLLVDFIDETVSFVPPGVLPRLREDLGLGFREAGLLISMLGLVGFIDAPLSGLLADFVSRRVLAVAGGLGMTAAFLLAALAPSFSVLLASMALLGFSSGFYVRASEVALLDLERGDRTAALTRFVSFGTAGDLAGPLLVAAAFWAGLAWRDVLLAAGAIVFAHALLLARRPFPPPPGHDGVPRWRSVAATLRERRVLRLTALLAANDVLDEGFTAFVLLYLVQSLGLQAGAASAAIGAAVLAQLVGLALLPRWTAALGARGVGIVLVASTLAGIVALVVLPGLGPKLAALVALWSVSGSIYPLFKAEAIAARPDNVGTVSAIVSMGGFPAELFPLLAGTIADAAGLDVALLTFAVAPAAMLALLAGERVLGLERQERRAI